MSDTAETTQSAPTKMAQPVPAEPMSTPEMRASAEARVDWVVEQLTEARKQRLALNVRIKALVEEEVEAARILRAAIGPKKKK